MKIGFFDSGLGGLSVAKQVISVLPAYDYFYVGDNKNAPYGSKSQGEIYQFTRRGIAWLFEQGCALVIIACNTASAQALRRLQQEWLPQAYPNRKLLGVIIPIAQEVAAQSEGIIGVIATPATVTSKTYVKELHKINPQLKVIQVAAPELASSIEEGATKEELRALLTMYLYPFQAGGIDTLILGSTHYELIASLFSEMLRKDIHIPHAGGIVAQKLKDYLARHSEIEKKLTRGNTANYVTTGDAKAFSQLSERFLSLPIQAKQIIL